MQVRDIMSRDVECVRPGTTLENVAALFAARSISGAPVCDEEGHVLGVVCAVDLPAVTELRRRGLRRRPAARGERTAGDAMTRPAVTIAPERTVAAAASLMLERSVNRLPVVRGGRLVGILTRTDLVRALGRPDDEIAQALLEALTRRLRRLPTADVRADVRDGRVTLRGTVERRSQAELLPVLAVRVPGVVAVRSELAWRVDDLARRGSGRGPATAR